MLKTRSAALLIALFIAAIPAGAEEVYLSLQATGHKHYEIEGRFWTPGSPTDAWVVLSDYENLPQFVPSLKLSRVEERSNERILLRQEAVGRALKVFHRSLHVLLQIKEDPPRLISFADLAHQDFKTYSGSWRIEQAAGWGTWVNYRLEATPLFFAPGFVARKAFRQNAKDLLLSVQAEIIRRGQLSDASRCCSQSKN